MLEIGFAVQTFCFDVANTFIEGALKEHEVCREELVVFHLDDVADL